MLDPLSPVDIVLVDAGQVDPALDTKAMGAAGLEAYRRTRDPRHLRFLGGARPTRFTIALMPPTYATMVLEDAPGAAAREHGAFVAAVTRVTMPDGTVLQPDGEKLWKWNETFSAGTNEWYDRAVRVLGTKRCREAGRVAFERATLPEGALGPFVWPEASTPTDPPAVSPTP